jgi:hypothetical protein
MELEPQVSALLLGDLDRRGEGKGGLHIDIQDGQNQFRHNADRIGRFGEFAHESVVPNVYAILEYAFQGAQEAIFPLSLIR